MATEQITGEAKSTSTTRVLAQKLRRGSADKKNSIRTGDDSRKMSVNPMDSGLPKSTKSTTGLQAKFGAPLKAFRSRPQQQILNPPVTPDPPSATLAHLFFALPNELQVQILCELHFADILILRITSRSFLDLISINQSPIVRHHIKIGIPAHLLDLYPSPSPSNARLTYLFGLSYRVDVCSSLAGQLADFFTVEHFGHRTESSRQKFQTQRDRMWRRMTPWLIVLFHFLESYRATLTRQLLDSTEPGSSHYLQGEVVNTYGPQTVLVAHEMYGLLLRSLTRKLRPPSYAGRLERSVRGWGRPPPSQEDIVKVLLAGGLPEVNKIFQAPNYADRRWEVEGFVRAIDSRQCQTMPEAENMDTLTNCSYGYVHTHTIQRCFDTRTQHSSHTKPPFGKALSQAHPSLLSVWIPSAEATLLVKGAVDGRHQILSPNECISMLVGDHWNSRFEAFSLDGFTLNDLFPCEGRL